MNFPKFAQLAPSVLGILAGIATSVALSHGKLPSSKAVSVSAAPGPASTTVQVIQQEVDPTRLRELEAEVAALGSARPSGEGEGSEVENRPQLSREERRTLISEKIQAADQRFNQDPVDPGWTSKASGDLNTAISAQGERLGYSVVNAECKTQFCRATVHWKSYDLAEKNGHHLAEMQMHGLNCAQTIWVPDPDDRAAPMDTSVYLDCGELRAGRVTAL